MVTQIIILMNNEIIKFLMYIKLFLIFISSIKNSIIE